MQQVVSGQDNVLSYDVNDKSTGAPITSGTVPSYLRARNGDDAGKWWNSATETWDAGEVSAGAMSASGGSALWAVTIVAAAWTPGVTYDFYAIESGNLNLIYSEQVVTWSPPTTGAGGGAWDYTVTDSGTSQPIPDVTVWATTDSQGLHVVAIGDTNAFGVVTFYLVPGTWYIWRDKAGYEFENPDVEVIT
jgi:hypothetical protein